MNKIKNESGITLIALTVTIVVMMILIIGISAVMTTNIEIENYNKVKEDIVALTEAVKLYYLQNSKLPIVETPTISRLNIPTKDINPNDNNRYYYIDTSLLTDVQLNCGEGNTNKTYTSSDNDLYVLNEKSLTVYYLKGAVLDGKKHYTVVDDFQGGGFATDYYSKTNLPIISAVTMESSGADKTIVQPGETVTLKILLNYELTKNPTVKINDTVVTVTWDGKIGTASYTFAETPTDADIAKNGAEVPFSISGYTADGRTGSTITQVNFGKKVYISIGVIKQVKVGDYVDYKPALETETDETRKTYSLESYKSGVSGDPQIVAYESGLKWRILNINEDTGKIDIVSDPTTATVKFYGATGYNNGVYALNDVCEQLYSNKAKGITARSINLEDMEKNLTPTGLAERNKCTSYGVKYGIPKTLTEDNSYYPNNYKDTIGSGVDVAEDKADTITQPDITNAVDPYKESTYSKTLTSGYTQASTKNLTVTQTYYSIPINSTNYGAAASVLSNSNYYLVASRYVYAYSSFALFGLRYAHTGMHNCDLVSSQNHSYTRGYRLRAIVSLDSSALTEKTGNTWSTNM